MIEEAAPQFAPAQTPTPSKTTFWAKLFGFRQRNGFKAILFPTYLIVFASVSFFQSRAPSNAHEFVATGEAVAISEFLLHEQKNEVGPKYRDALDKHRQLVASTIKSISLHSSDSSEDKKLVGEMLSSLKQCEAILSAKATTEEEAADRITARSAGILENLCVKLARIKIAAAVPASKPFSLFPSRPNPFVSKFNEDLTFFESALKEFERHPDFERSQAVCMASRFAAMTALLGSPELAWDDENKNKLSHFVTMLTKVSERTENCSIELQKAADHLEGIAKDDQIKKAAMLLKYSKSELRRSRVLNGVLNNDFRKIVEIFAQLS